MDDMTSPIDILGVGTAMPAGIGLRDLRHALQLPVVPARLEGRSFAGACLPPVPARVMSDFAPKEHLGAKGLSTMDRTTQLAILGTGLALADAGLKIDGNNGAEVGVVLGSASGSIRSISEFVHSTYANDPPYTVSAMMFPNTVMNSAAGQCAIRHGLKGINSTLCAGPLSSMMAMRYSALMLRVGRARTLLAGGVEEYCEWTAWSDFARCEGDPGFIPGEGCAMFALAIDSASPRHGRLLACVVESAVEPRSNPAGFVEAFRQCLSRMLDRAQVQTSELAWWAPQAANAGEAELERKAVAATLGAGRLGHDIAEVHSGQYNGSPYSAGAAFQLATAIALGRRGYGLVTGVSAAGGIGCMLVYLENKS